MSPEEMTREQLVEIVKKLPITKDGIRVVPGLDEVFYTRNGVVSEPKLIQTKELIEACYSSRAAAEQAVNTKTSMIQCIKCGCLFDVEPEIDNGDVHLCDKCDEEENGQAVNNAAI